MPKNKGLGKGLDSLIPKDFDQSLLLDKSDRIQKIAIKDIAPNPDQPRKDFKEDKLNELSRSIKMYGVLQPIIVSQSVNKALNTKYIIVAGERRWRASKLAGLNELPAIVRSRSELEQLEVSLIENVQREDLAPIEQAISIERLHKQFNYPYKKIALRLGKAEATVSNIVRLLDLPEASRKALEENTISEGHARAILALRDYPDQQQTLLDLIIKNKWSVRQAEQYVTALKSGAKSAGAAKKKTVNETPATKKLGSRLGRKVTVRRTAKGGKLEIHFKDDNDLQALIKNF